MPDHLLTALLKNRGITTEEERERFLRPSYENHTHDPFLLPHMEKAVQRILRAIAANESIVVYSDYDADGIPGAVVLHDFFKKIAYEHFSNYIPHRHDEGFGLNIEAIDVFIKDGAKVVITIDCGITDVEEIAKAQAAGIDVIVTDHHIPHGTMPAAYAIVNPKVAEEGREPYPFADLCGAAVAYKLVQALIARGDFDITTGWEKWLLDMVGIATLSDMVPLVGENRVLAKYGLMVLRKSPRPGLTKLFSRMNVRQQSVTEDDITFMVAPRINAASRLGEPIDAFNMLAETDTAKAYLHAEHLIELNDLRKRLTASVSASARSELAKRRDRAVIVIGDPEWKPGIAGLVANSLAEEYKRPVFVWGRDGGTVIKGSARTGDSTNLVILMEEAKDLFIDFGGHAASGGFSISHENIDRLEEALNQAHALIMPGGAEKKEERVYESEIASDALTPEILAAIESMSPFGIGNQKPLFLIKNVQPSSIKAFGKTSAHTEFSIEAGRRRIQAIAFFKTPAHFPHLADGKNADILGSLERSYWSKKEPLRIRITDIL